MVGPMESSDDRSPAIVAARTGDLAAFEALMGQYERLVLATALRLLGNLEDAQDASQEVFLKLYRNLKKLENADTGSIYARGAPGADRAGPLRRRPRAGVSGTGPRAPSAMAARMGMGLGRGHGGGLWGGPPGLPSWVFRFMGRRRRWSLRTGRFRCGAGIGSWPAQSKKADREVRPTWNPSPSSC
jgi:hypothetical protein